MKNILVSLAFLAVTVPAFAHHGGSHHGHHPGHHARPGHHFNHHHHHYHRRHWHHDHRWVAPLIIGGVATYALTRPDPVIIREQPVIVEQQPLDIVPGTNCTPWKEIQQPDGTIVRERTCQR